MFIETKTDNLHQGDILEQVLFTPCIFHKAKDGQFTLPQTLIRRTYLVIISHCCELTWYENDQGKLQPRRPYILVAPLSLKLPFEVDSPEYQRLIENGISRPENDPVQFFYYQNNDVIGSESVVDFSTILPIRHKLLLDIGLKKLLQLNVKHRHLFRTKLHEYFSRIPEEEWEEVQQLFPEDFT